MSVRAFSRFRGDLARHRRALAAAVLCALGYAACRLAEPWPLKVVFDNALAGMPLQTPSAWVDEHIGGSRTLILVAATVAILVFALLRSLFYYAQRSLTARVGQDVVLELRRRLFAHLQRLPLSFHTRSQTGDLLARLTGDIAMLRELLVASLLSVVTEGVVLVGFVTVMFLIEWRLALVAVLALPVIFAAVTVYSGRMRTATRKQRRREGEIAARLHEVLAGIQVVQLFGREEEEDERLAALNKRSYRSGMRATRLEARLARTVELAVACTTAAVLWVGATQVIAGRLTPGELIVFFAYMQGFYRPLRRISRVSQRASKASTCLERVTSILDRPSELVDGWHPAPPLSGARIVLDRVSFAYEPGREVLHEVTVALQPGRTLALVGPSGAGKSTILGLVPRLYDPSSGRVLVDGIDVRELTLASLRAQVAAVPQEPILFSGTIFENIAYGELDATRERVEAAARAAHVDEFVRRLPEGYGSIVGERGLTLSGGQRQRLAIARALVKDAPIVLLDEPTASLDPGSEALVLSALARLLVGRTAILVAHTPELLRLADEVVVLDRGAVVKRTSPGRLLGRRHRLEALLAARPRYGVA